MNEQTLPETTPQWHRVSPKYALADLAVNLLSIVLPIVALVVVLLVKEMIK